MEEIEDESVAERGYFWVVAVAFVMHEGMLSIEFVPGEVGFNVVEGVVELLSAV